MINAMHALVYADDADAARAFFRDVLGFPYIDSGAGWLIFGTGPSELGVHPTSDSGISAGGMGSGLHHEVSLVCDDIHATVAELSAKGAEFMREVRDDGFGLTTSVRVPGAGELLIYQQKHAPAYEL